MDGAFTLRAGLRSDAYAEAYARDGVVQIEGLFPPAVADELSAVLERATPWSLVHSGAAGEHKILTPADLARLPQADVAARLRAVVQRAGHGFAYLYLVYPMIDAYLELKWEEVYAFEHTPHPIEFQMYYSV